MSSPEETIWLPSKPEVCKVKSKNSFTSAFTSPTISASFSIMFFNNSSNFSFLKPAFFNSSVIFFELINNSLALFLSTTPSTADS